MDPKRIPVSTIWTPWLSIRIYESMGFVPADHRNSFGTDFLRMIYSSL